VGLTSRNAMLDLAPEYFKFTQSTYNKATSLVKIVGFFSVMTHDRKSGVKKNMDLLVMENLFHDHEITKTYDLKGIGELIPLVRGLR
jgi:1-phosphatidylinositol-3-phosphate 5-kinase